MKNKVIWKFIKKHIDENIILQIQENLNIKFPSDYIECVIKNNGGRPNPDSFDFEGHEEAVFNSLLSLHSEDKENMISVCEWIRYRLPGNVIPFANDPLGNYICFDYRENNNPVIVFWDHEIAGKDKEKCLTKICNSFDELLSRLY